jgi:hypothetical protein
MKQQTAINKNKVLHKLYNNPQYAGKHVITLGEKVFEATSSVERKKLLQRLKREYPHKRPLIMYIPAEESLIL